MTTRDFLLSLRARDVRVRAERDRLLVSAPQGLLTPELQRELQARKPEIIAFLGVASAPHSSLVHVQSAGSRPPFFAVPGHNGDVFCYVRLAHHLGGDQPFCAFEPPGLDDSRTPLDSVEALAAQYAEDLRGFQPEGPYLIGGYCLGGMVAFELARQLRAQGQEVGLLVLFESMAPSALWPWNRRVLACRYRRDQILRRLRALAGQPWSARFAFASARLARLGGSTGLGGPPEDAVERRQELKDRVGAATTAAAVAYAQRPGEYPGTIVHFLGSKESERLAYGRQRDWERFATGGLEVEVGPPGCDGDVMLREPYVRVFANLLRRRLDRVAAQRPRPARPAASSPPILVAHPGDGLRPATPEAAR